MFEDLKFSMDLTVSKSMRSSTPDGRAVVYGRVRRASAARAALRYGPGACALLSWSWRSGLLPQLIACPSGRQLGQSIPLPSDSPPLPHTRGGVGNCNMEALARYCVPGVCRLKMGYLSSVCMTGCLSVALFRYLLSLLFLRLLVFLLTRCASSDGPYTASEVRDAGCYMRRCGRGECAARKVAKQAQRPGRGNGGHF
jgi:hypothetical protein